MKIDDLTVFFNMVDKSGKTFSRIQKRFKALKKVAVFAFKAIGVAAAGVVGSMGLIAGAFKALQGDTDAFSKAAQKLGIAADDFKAFSDAAELAGISSEKLTSSIQRFSRRVAEAQAKGTGPLIEELEKMNLSAAELVESGPAAAFETILEKINEIEDPMERLRLAFQFFGKEGADLVRLTGGAIQQAREEMERFGTAMSQLELTKIEAANDAMRRVERVVEGVRMKIASGLAVAVSTMSRLFLESLPNVDNLGTAVERFVTAGIVGIGHLVDAFDFLRIGVLTIERIIHSVERAFLKMIFSTLDGLNKIPGVSALVSDATIEQFRVMANLVTDDIDRIDEKISFLGNRNYSEEVKKVLAEIRAENEATAAAVTKAADSAKTLKTTLESIPDAGGTAANAVSNASAGQGAFRSAGGRRNTVPDQPEVTRQDPIKAISDLATAFDAIDSIYEDAFQREIARIDAQRDILETKALELNQSRIRNQQMMQQLGVTNLRTNAFDDELEKIRGQQAQLDAMSKKAYEKRKKDFDRNKKIQKAAAIIEGIAAGVKSFNAAGGYPYGLAALAASLATTYAQVRKICQTKFDGGGAGAGGAAGGTGAGGNAGQGQGGTQSTSQPGLVNGGGGINITIEGSEDSTFSYQQVKTLVDQIKEAGLGAQLANS